MSVITCRCPEGVAFMVLTRVSLMTTMATRLRSPRLAFYDLPHELEGGGRK